MKSMRAKEESRSKEGSKSKDRAEVHPREAVLSENMIEVLRLLNEFGFCDIRHVCARFKIKKTVAYECMRALIQYGLVENARVILYQPRAYYLTAKGVALLKLDLPLIRKIPLNVYEHQLSVLDVYIKLNTMHPESSWISERRLIRDKYSSGMKDSDHLPDGAVMFSQGHQCAIEVEKSLKARDRLDQILMWYGLQKNYREVWYFCTKEVIGTISQLANGLPYVKVYNLSEFLI